LIYLFSAKADKKSAMVNISKWVRSQSAGIIYGILSLAFLWMSLKVVNLYEAFPDYFANDAYFIVALLVIEALVLFVLCAVITGLHVPDKYKRLFNISCVLFSVLYVFLPLNAFPGFLEAVKGLLSRFS
jgi:hypothetical protein